MEQFGETVRVWRVMENSRASIIKDLDGEAGGTRTLDPRLKRPLLYQLSYRPLMGNPDREDDREDFIYRITQVSRRSRRSCQGWRKMSGSEASAETRLLPAPISPTLHGDIAESV